MTQHRVGTLAVVTTAMLLAGCSSADGPQPAATKTAAGTATTTATAPPDAQPQARPSPTPGEQPVLASDPVQLADGLIADEQALRDPSSPEPVLTAAARRQQVAYRALGRNPEWAAIVRPRIPGSLLENYDLNVTARRQLTTLSEGTLKSTLPAWRIVPPRPAAELLGYYREAEAAHGVGWNYLAAINLIETGFGRIAGVSTAGAQGPMQFLPSTFAAYGDGGDINSPHDSIMAAGRYLAANNFAGNRDNALYRYNNSNHYVRAVSAYATALAADPSAFNGYYRWEIFYNTTSGDVLLPIGYSATERIPVAQYLAEHPR